MPSIGLIGAGQWGRLILTDLVGLGAEVHVVDPDPRVRATASTIGAASTAVDIEELGDVSGLIVATPATTHATILEHLADREVPVFCEKPLTTDVDAARLVAARLGDRLHVMHVWRYHHGVELLGTLATDGSLGQINALRSTRANWTSPRTDTDSSWTLLPHDLSIAIEILGSVPTPVTALAERIRNRIVGVWATLHDPGGPWMIVEASNRHSDKRREVRLHGTEGVAVLDASGPASVTIIRGDGIEPEVSSIPYDPEPPLRRQLAAFLDHLGGGPPPKSDGAEGVAVVEAVAAIRQLCTVEP